MKHLSGHNDAFIVPLVSFLVGNDRNFLAVISGVLKISEIPVGRGSPVSVPRLDQSKVMLLSGSEKLFLSVLPFSL